MEAESRLDIAIPLEGLGKALVHSRKPQVLMANLEIVSRSLVPREDLEMAVSHDLVPREALEMAVFHNQAQMEDLKTVSLGLVQR